ncbi:hypothetical protein V3C99_011316 [Haemonchus contortus]|uniref:HTH_Tnp_Tc3_2 domain-containing protein n=1 Tax=Haemonchus contortus TaxID=6289 RepID=A0A7I4Y704_HAECO
MKDLDTDYDAFFKDMYDLYVDYYRFSVVIVIAVTTVSSVHRPQHHDIGSCRRQFIVTADLPNPSLSAAQRLSERAGLFGRRPAEKPLISAKNFKARLDWAHAHKKWTIQQWRKVIWSDESKFLLFRVKFVQLPVGTRCHPGYQMPTVKGGVGSVMVHGSFYGEGVGPLHMIMGKMDSEMYLNIWRLLSSRLFALLLAVAYFPTGKRPKYESNLFTRWFRDNNDPLLTWPSQYPDLNLWATLKRQVKGLRARNEHGKFPQLKTGWENVPPAEIDRLIECTPRRCQVVIDAKGYAAKYILIW